jgi:hypothetical protein
MLSRAVWCETGADETQMVQGRGWGNGEGRGGGQKEQVQLNSGIEIEFGNRD